MKDNVVKAAADIQQALASNQVNLDVIVKDGFYVNTVIVDTKTGKQTPFIQASKEAQERGLF